MKHFRLLLTLLTLIIGGVSVSAQTWTGSEVGEGKALLYNVGTGKYLTRGNGWNTQASIGTERAAMTVLLENYDGKYKIRTNVNGDGKGFEHLSGGTVYSDQSANKNSTWTFTNVGTNEAPVYNIISADNHGGGEGAFLTAEGGESTIVGPGTDGNSDNAKWKIYLIEDQKAKVLAAMPNATAENPIDATVLIGNPDFSTAIAPTGQPWTMEASNQNLSGGATLTNPVAESYRSTFTLSQIIDVPNGYYSLQAQAFIREYTETGADYPVVYINDATKPFVKMVTETASLADVSNYFANNTDGGYYTGWTDAVQVTSGSITIGVRGTRTDTWCAWDNFQLQYLGPINDLSAYAADLAAAVAAAEATEGTIPTAAYNEIAAVVTAKNKTYDNADDYTAAIQAINNAVAQYATAAIVADYSRYKDVKTAVLAVAPNTVTTTADTQVEAASTVEAVDASIATLRGALLTELSNLTIAEGEYIDVTNALVDNPTVRQSTNYWTIEGTPNGGYSWGKVSNEECEFYNQNFKFYQTIALSAGTWEFGVTGFHRGGQGEFDTYFYAGEDKILIPGVESSVVNTMAAAKEYFDNGNGKVALKFALEENKNIEIGIENQDTNTDKWTIFRDFTLKYYGSSIDLTPYKEALAETVAAANELQGTIPSAAYTQLTTVVNENNKEYTTVTDYQAAKAAIDEAIATAKSLQTPYSRYQAIKTAVLALDDDTEAFTGEATVSTTDADEAVEAATTIEAIESAITLLRADAKTFLDAIALNEGKKIDVTNVWVTNPGFEEGNVNGWTNSGTISASAQSNKAFDNTQGNYYAERWHAEGTVNLNQTLTGLPAGNYEISAYLYTDTPDGVLYANNAQTAFNTSGNYSVTVEIDDNGSITFGASCTLTASTWICMDGFKIEYKAVDHSRYNTVREAVLAISNTLDIAAADALNASAKRPSEVDAAVDKIREILLAYIPTVELAEGEHIDLTNAIIDNPTVRENVDYWNVEDVVRPYSWSTGPTTNYSETEFYQSNFNFNQIISGLPIGTYEFGVTGFHRAGNHATYFYAGEDKVLIPGVESSVVNSMAEAKSYFDDGNGKVALKFALESESNDIKIGIVNNDTETDRWTIFRDFTLKYFGSQVDLSIYEDAWQEAVAAANAAIEANPNVTGEELTAVNAAKADVPEATKASYLEKTEALTAATAALVAAATSYNKFAETKTIIDELTLPYADQAKKPTTEGIDDPTNATDADTKVVAMLVSLRPYYESNALAEGVQGAVNMTDMIGQSYAPATAEEITAWTITDNSETYDPTIRSNEPFTQGDGTSGGPYYDGGDLWNTTYIANYKQEIELPAGKYLLTVTARASQACKKFELYAGENTVEMTKIGAAVGTGVFDRGWNDEFVEFTLSEKQTVEIGVNIEQDKNYNWYSFSRFRLVQLEGDADQAGDVNGDTKVDVADITAMVNIIVAHGYEKVADLDGDNDVDTEDVKALVNLVLGEE